METKQKYPLIPLREVVLFPDTLFPILIARPFSLKAARHALSMGGEAVFFTQKKSTVEDPKEKDLFRVGVVGKFIQHVVAPDGSIRTLVQGISRVRLLNLSKDEGYFTAEVEEYPWERLDPSRIETLTRMLKEYFREYVEFNRMIPDDVVINVLERQTNIEYLAPNVTIHLPISFEEKQELLETPTFDAFLDKLVKILLREIEFLRLKSEIEDRVREEIKKSQKQYFLQQEIKELQKELGGEKGDEFAQLEEKIKKAGMPKEVREKALSELNKLKRTPMVSPEATVIRNYLDWLIALPWKKKTRDNLDLANARKVLDEDHYGLEEPKERILEYLAVLKLKGKIKGQVICFVGPPGVGKTSLARSIARALGRKFVRISLGGMRDEAEIRGHRRTYVGALPGRIIQQIKRAGTKNPVFLLDEIDKVGQDFRGDPQAALMEVLDPEVNQNFQDHYLEVDFDLSEVLFITTANSLYGIPRPLLDRMEVIQLRGYLDFEKLEIAKRHLIPKKLEEIGLPDDVIEFTDKAILKIIREYTREAGVRELERSIARIMRKVAKRYLETGKKETITDKNLKDYLGLPKYRMRKREKVLPIGVAYGLAWTEFGGDLLKIESALMKGSGKLELTGSLGDVMKESAKAALSYIRAHYRRFNLPSDFYKDVDLHLHIPEGAIPKDGPSAGVAILAAMISAFTKTPVPGDVAMTGEITLSGEILPVGGLEEKILAARRSGIKKVILPHDNKNKVRTFNPEIKKGLKLVFVKSLDEFVDELFENKKWEKTLPEFREGEYSSWVSL